MTEETLFHQALLKPHGEREAFLIDACAGKPELLAAVKSLLAAYEASSGFLKHPPEELARTDGPKSVPGWNDLTGAYTPNPEDPKPSHSGLSYLAAPGPGLVIAGRYTLVEKIGEGGMGVVWIANQTEPIKRKVALKVIRTGMDSGSVLARFEQERQALALMDHPNIARVLDGGVIPTGQPFFVMELVNGLPLNKFCDEARLTLRERLELFVPICQAIQHAHQKGIIHRDLKPANILITLVDGRPTPKVIDFGVAKATGDKIIEDSIATHFGAVVGTLEYMSPEQAGLSSEGIDTRSDIYSLGVILYELLTGLRPFDSTRLKKAALTEVIRIIREEDPSRPSTRLSTDESLPSLAAMRRIEPRKLMSMLRGELDWVVMKCLEKSRDRRYETANGLARDIQRYLADEPVEARPPSPGYRLGKFIRRNKGVVIASTLVFLSLVGGIIGTSIGMIQAEKNRAEADKAWSEEALRAEGEREARKQETQQRERAEKARDRTRQALDAMTSSVTGDSLTSQQEVTEEQKKFLSEVLTYYQEFAGENQEDEKSQALGAMAAHRVGIIEIRLGHKKQGLQNLLQALERLEFLEKQFPNTPGYLRALIGCHNDLGNLRKDMGKWSESENHFTKAVFLSEKLIATLPGRPEDENGLALTLNHLGVLFTRIGKNKRAWETFPIALGIQKKISLDNPTNPKFGVDLSRTHHNFGFLLTENGKWEDAYGEYQQALLIRQNLVRDFPNEKNYQELLARTHNNLGLVLEHQDKMDQAEKQYLLAKGILENLVIRFPGAPLLLSEFASCRNNLGGLYLARGEYTKSEDHFRVAQGILENLVKSNPLEPDYRHSLANTHYNLGLVFKKLGRNLDAETKLRNAVIILDQLAKENPFQPDFRKDLANVHSEMGIVTSKEREKFDHFKKAQELREGLVSEFPSNPKYRENLATGHINTGLWLRDAGRLLESRIEYTKAQKLQEQLLGEFPKSPGLLQDLAQTYSKLATNHQESGEEIQAEMQYRKALIHQENLVNLFPKNLEYRDELAITTNNLGILLANLKRGEEAQELYRKANSLFAQLVSENPKVPNYKKQLASNHNNQGLFLASQGKFPPAEEHYRKALEIQEKLVAENPGEVTYAVDLGGGYSNFGGLLFTTGKKEEGITFFSKAIQILTPAVTKAPSLITARNYLRTSHSNRARAFSLLNRFGEAIPDWDQAIRLGAGLEKWNLRASRATALAKSGKPEEAVAEVTDLIRTNRGTAFQAFEFACIHSLASAKESGKKQENADKAMEFLQKSVAGGYKNPTNFARNPDLDPLRTRDDFKKLMANLSKESPTKKP